MEGDRAARAGRAALALTEIRDVAPGLWIWRQPHPDWQAGLDWEETVTSTCVESRGEVAVIDALAPAEGSEAWARFDARPPTLAIVLKPDHVRDIDVFVRRYGARGFGPRVYFRDDLPETVLEPLLPDGQELPGGLRTLYDGRSRDETPLWLPEQRALVFADALAARGGELRVWGGMPWHEQAVLPALRALLELPFELVIVAHGEPVHDRAAFERALELPPGP